MKLKILAVAGLLAGVCGLALGNGAYAAEIKCPAGSLRENDSSVKSYAECNIPKEEEGDKGLMQTVVDILNIIVGVVGIVAVAVVILGGVLYVVSTGEAAKVQRAKNTILYGIVGLVVSLLAFALVNFVLNAIFNKSSSGDGSKGGDQSQEDKKDDE